MDFLELLEQNIEVPCRDFAGAHLPELQAAKQNLNETDFAKLVELMEKSKGGFLVAIRILIAFVGSLGISSFFPAYSKPIWLECGNSEISLDMDKERYSMKNMDEVNQGPVVYGPDRIDFQAEFPFGSTQIKYLFSIERKTLEYTKTTLAKGGLFLDSSWRLLGDHPEVGTCSLRKNPTKGNKI